MPPKSPSPLLGYNNNVRHKGKVFHVQTEDSGIKYGHIITHLFMDGGRILKSVKTSYAEYVDNDRMGEIVREMMRHQHKAMFIALRDGKFDALVDGANEPKSSPSLPDAVDPLEPTEPGAMASSPEPPVSATVRTAVNAAKAEAARSEAALTPPAELPPPPANLLREKVSTGRYRDVPPAANQSAEVPARGRSAVSATTSSRAPAGERRYAPTRPASIFGQAKPQQGKSIFGEDLISDKSLDDVILSYLAEDLEDGKKKK